MGRVIWFEIHADDPQRAMGFYEKLLGWQFTRQEGAPIPYWRIKTGDEGAFGIDGGLMPRQGGSGNKINSFVCTIEVDDLDATVAHALGMGAEIAMPRFPVPGIGWMAYVKDTEDNVIGLMQGDPAAK